MIFLKEIGLMVLLSNRRSICRDIFKIWILFSQIPVEQRSMLCEFVDKLHADAFIKPRISAQLYGIEKRIGKKYRQQTNSKEDENCSGID